MRHYLYTFCNGVKTLYIFVSTENPMNARSMAWEAIQGKFEAPSIIGLNYVKQLIEFTDFSELVRHNEHYNLNFEEIDNLLIKKIEGVSIGDFVKE